MVWGNFNSLVCLVKWGGDAWGSEIEKEGRARSWRPFHALSWVG